MYPELVNHDMRFNPDFLGNGEVFHTPDFVDEKPSLELNESCLNSDSSEVHDFSDACIKFLSDILLEEDLDETPAIIQDFGALQATEKSLYDALGEEYSPPENPSDNFDGGFDRIEGYSNGYPGFESDLVQNQEPLVPFISLDDLSNSFLELSSQSPESSISDDSKDGVVVSPASTITVEPTQKASTITSEPAEKVNKLPNRSRKKKNRQRDEGGYEDGRSNKHQASSNEDYVEMKEYDDVLLCREEKDDIAIANLQNEVREKLQKKGSKGRTARGKKKSDVIEEVDLRTLLNHCAQAVSSFDLRSANERLKQIRQHSSQYGDSIQRVAHYFANGLEARIAGTGSTVSTNIVDARISSSDFLKAYRAYVSAIPFKRMSYFLANNKILKLAETARKIHIIDFGILLGLQWPCLIQALSKRSGSPPELRITGIDYPQHGFRPAERVEATGRRLAGYCERFNVPFKYQAIAQKWNTIKPEDLKIEGDELVIVNCMYRSGTLLDETVEADSSKDAFLRLVKQLNPHIFIHGVVNGTFNAPFFITRFKEALFHYSSIFDVFEATIPREDHGRLLIESEMYGKESLNVIACEGAERIQRPESYKQWQVRTTRGGFRQLPMDRELLSRAKAKAEANYLKDFVVDEDRRWMLQGWKGRIFCALSFWQAE